MAYEIELKAWVEDENVEEVKAILSKISCSEVCLEEVHKDDIYWALSEDNDDSLFRTRLEKIGDKEEILFTRKPSKSKDETGIEFNEEVEYCVSANQWENVLKFIPAMGYEIVKHKWKDGWHCYINKNSFDIHVELLKVKFLGWFLEMEICPSTLEGFDSLSANNTLKEILRICNISLSSVEPRGYNRMLTAIGKDKG
ncbi:MAG: CYTH domain-containing protein [Sphaerochaetaceae bacterium]|nr:CYTH domain-containing protein [Sphaerochaetaceae bacterium]